MTMTSTDEEPDDESEIDDLLKALDGIERCFVPDFEEKKVTKKNSIPIKHVEKTLVPAGVITSVDTEKRNVNTSPSPVPPVKGISLKDPRLRKMLASSRPTVTKNNNFLLIPTFAKSSDFPVPNGVTSRSKISVFRSAKSIENSKQSPICSPSANDSPSKYLKTNSSLNEETVGKSKRKPFDCSSKSTSLTLLEKTPKLDSVPTVPINKCNTNESRNAPAVVTKSYRRKVTNSSERKSVTVDEHETVIPASIQNNLKAVQSEFQKSIVPLKLVDKNNRNESSDLKQSDSVEASDLKQSKSIQNSNLRKVSEAQTRKPIKPLKFVTKDSVSNESREIQKLHLEKIPGLKRRKPMPVGLQNSKNRKVSEAQVRKSTMPLEFISRDSISNEFSKVRKLDRKKVAGKSTTALLQQPVKRAPVGNSTLKNVSEPQTRKLTLPLKAVNRRNANELSGESVPVQVEKPNEESVPELSPKKSMPIKLQKSAKTAPIKKNSRFFELRIKKPTVPLESVSLSNANESRELPVLVEKGNQESVPDFPKRKFTPIVLHKSTINTSVEKSYGKSLVVPRKANQSANKAIKLNLAEITVQLPTEILIKIFKHLSIRDRKNVKLVCKSWYDICNTKPFTSRERFVCCGHYSTVSILQTIVNSSCECYNLEFYRVNFSESFTQYWRRIATKIRALYFVDCVISEQTFQDVIVNCTEMEHLSLSFQYLKIPLKKFFGIALFKNLQEQKIERPKLTSFDVQINPTACFTNTLISNLFAIYPNISRLGFTCHSLDLIASETEAVPPNEIEFSDLWSSNTLTFSPILKYILSPPDCMQKLRLHVHTKRQKTGFAWQSIIMHSQFTRLREIVIEIDLRKLSANEVIEFCCAQKELKSLSCKILGIAKLFVSLFLLKLLDNCPRLRYLDISYQASFLMSNELLKGLVMSELKTLSIEAKNVVVAPQIISELAWASNENLRSLSLSQDVGKDLKSLLLRLFRNLTFLEIHNLCDELLQLIWQFQTNLVGLKLAGVEECTIDGFCGVPENTAFSIRNLQGPSASRPHELNDRKNSITRTKNLISTYDLFSKLKRIQTHQVSNTSNISRALIELEYLVLEAVNNEWHVYGNVFSEFQFPKLRYLCVDIEAGSETLQSDLVEAMKTFRNLEAMSINCSGIMRSGLFGLKQFWKNLRYLRIVDKESKRLRPKKYYQSFKVSSKLRALVHEFEVSTESFYYDVIDKKVKRKIDRAKYRISSEKIGKCFIDWLWF